MQSELARALEDNELEEFKNQLRVAKEVNYSLDYQYGKEVIKAINLFMGEKSK